MATSKTVTADNLANEIANILTEYKDDLDDLVVDITDEVVKEARDELKIISPVGETGEYRDGWTISVRQKGINFFSKAVWNKKHYRLTHLLEFGHATKNGGHTTAQPHVRPTEQKYKEKFVDEFERRVKR
ncbi:MAG TPA: HK97 gp10 family phage protein [Candidatus Onthousia faecavium]|nr:HK97 gp10 family phage protein [Candidatus Onthousia faecavium]